MVSAENEITPMETVRKDLLSGLVVFLVALPLCLGIALASGAPLFSGVLAGIIGGIVVGVISGSHTSVSGPAAGLTAVVSAQIALLGGSFEAFLTAVLIAGVMQIAMGVLQAGAIAEFFPTSVIKGLLAAIGIILIFKQIPHLFGHDVDPDGEMSFWQLNQRNTFTELWAMINDLHVGAIVIGFTCLAILIVFGRSSFLKKLNIPAPLVVVVVGTLMKVAFDSLSLGTGWEVGPNHLVQFPVASNFNEFLGFLQMADFSQLTNPAIYTAAVTIALVASLETLLNLEAVDNLDKQQRHSPPNRELIAQGVGNVCAGLVGAIPVTSVIIRSSVNIDSGGRTKAATIFHGFILLACAALLPQLLNKIPLSCLAAILIVTGFKLASPDLVRQMWRGGRYVFIPFVVTTLAIVVTNLLDGVLIGLAVSILFILHSNLKRPLRRTIEKHVGGDVLRIELASQVSFLNRAAISRALHKVEDGGHVLIDASGTDYIGPDVLDLIHNFETKVAPAHNIKVSLLGFRRKYQMDDQIQYVDVSDRDSQEKKTPAETLQLLLEGNKRFRDGQQLTRDLRRQVAATAEGQFPMAVVLTCIDSRTPPELVFDLGLGDVFSARVAGNIISRKIMGSVEYGCAHAGSNLVLVMGHTRCGAVTAAVDLACAHKTAMETSGCENIDSIVDEIHQSIDDEVLRDVSQCDAATKHKLVNRVAERNVHRMVERIRESSAILRDLESKGEIAIVGSMYDVGTGEVEVITEAPA